MTRYFLHLRNGMDECLDPEGKDYDDMDRLKEAVLISARDVMAGDLCNGIIDLRFRIDVEDARGKTIYSLAFRDAMRIIPENE